MSDAKKPEEVKELWADLRLILEAMEKDLDKNLNKGNTAAGRRVRANLRDLKNKATELIREMVALDKARKG
jgi:hypothetical protein